ncbi:hypothetical protein [Pedobacter sp.]|jgi:hypothetical protein|uniref:hypothetical protein n=1 Tax=Pedobacter sp. TaxID=1411316 RepID=UPI002BE3B33C|nr:hypothetical protein [Pedobacter sp.]HWW40738.1 hypothetical protein [Pedobacter sp.]
MIKTNDLVQYFWTHANLITTKEGVEAALHGDQLIEVSVMLRNHEENVVRLQLRSAFTSPLRFIEAFNLQYPEDIKKISMENLMILYKNGKAELCVTEF